MRKSHRILRPFFGLRETSHLFATRCGFSDIITPAIMFQQRFRFYQYVQLTADILLTALCLPVAYYLRLVFPNWLPSALAGMFNPEIYPLEKYLILLTVILPVWIIVLYFNRSHRLLLTERVQEHVLVLARLEMTGALIIGFISFFFQFTLSRSLFFFFLLTNAIVLFLSRLLLGWYIRNRSIRDFNLRRVVIVGTDEEARHIGSMVEKYRFCGITLGGYLTLPGEKVKRGGQDPSPLLGSLDDLPELVRREVIDEIVFVGGATADGSRFHDSFRFCEELGLQIRLAADLFPRSISRISIDHLEDIPLITFTSVPDHGLALMIKRLMDVVFGSVFLLLSLPLMLITAICIKSTSAGPIFYRQVRCGLYGRRFTLYKFRSMVDGAEDILWEIRHLNEMSGPVFKMRNDPRVTPLGRILRKTSIDELPQFWNVLRGEMSLVGPRAPLPEEVEAYTNGQRRRLSVKPGITCLWQVSGRSQIDFLQWMQLDLHYIDHWSLWLDWKILFKTIPTVLFCRGAH